MCSVDALHLKVKRGMSVVIGKTVSLVSSVGRAPNLQAGVLHQETFSLSLLKYITDDGLIAVI